MIYYFELVCFLSRAGRGRDFVPGYPNPSDPWVPITIAFWACPQLENIYLNEINNVSLSLAQVCMERIRTCRNVRVTVYKSGLARCGGNIYKPIMFNYAVFT